MARAWMKAALAGMAIMAMTAPVHAADTIKIGVPGAHSGDLVSFVEQSSGSGIFAELFPMIRHANRSEATEYRGHFEITSLVGTIDPAGEHLHLTITDPEGRAFGGHLLAGSSVYTTAEIVVLILEGLIFSRAPCPYSGYDELVVKESRAETP